MSKRNLPVSLVWVACLATPTFLLAGDISGTVTCKGVRDNANAVVYIEKVAEAVPAPEKPVVMDQKDLEFIPHVLPIVKGTTVDFLNSDDVLHNVFSPDDCAEKMNLGTWAKGEVRSYCFKEEGCMPVLLCNVHPEMEAWIVVLQNGYFSKTGKDGKYTIEGVPAGKYTLVAWHEKLKPDSVEVEVPVEGRVPIDFTLARK